MHEDSTQPSRYRVVVRGRLGEHLTGAFEHLELDSQPGESSLTGTFADQAQLHGLLDRLRDLGIQLISVNPVEDGGFPHSTRRPAT
jgi:hypothetical protein